MAALLAAAFAAATGVGVPNALTALVPEGAGPSSGPACAALVETHNPSVANNQHGWQSTCGTSADSMCTLLDCTSTDESVVETAIGLFEKNVSGMSAMDTAMLGFRHMAALKQGSSLNDTTCAALSGKTLRLRLPLSDGFFVRALMVSIVGNVAAQCGAPFFVDPAISPGCTTLNKTCDPSLSGLVSPGDSSDCVSRHVCDAYYDASLANNSWEQYFEPVGDETAAEANVRLASSPVAELSGELSWALFIQNTPFGAKSDYASWTETRTTFAGLAALFVRVRSSIKEQAAQIWKDDVTSKGATKVLGVHMRGTDKFLSRKVEPEEYFSYIDSYISAQEALGHTVAIFLATDDTSYRSRTVTKYGSRVVEQPNVSRASGSDAIWKSANDTTSPSKKGQTVLLDSLLLSKCDFLLKSASAVSEFAIYFNAKLIRKSYDFSLTEHPQPTWAQDKVLETVAASTETAAATRPVIGLPVGCLNASFMNMSTSLSPDEAIEIFNSCSATAKTAATRASAKLEARLAEYRNSTATSCSANGVLRIKPQPFTIGWTSHLHAWLKAYMKGYDEDKPVLSPPSDMWFDPRFCGGMGTAGCLFEHQASDDCDEMHAEDTSYAGEEVLTTLDRKVISYNPPILTGKAADGLENMYSWYLKGDALIPKEYSEMNWFWYTSAMFTHAFKPSATLQKAIDAALASTGLGAALGGSTPILGMQVRRGDKCSASWSKCIEFSEYMLKAEEYRTAYGINTIYLATDSTDVLKEAQTIYTNWTFLHFKGGHDFAKLVELAFPVSLGSASVWDNVVPRLQGEGRTYINTLNAWLTQIEITLLSKCDAFIGQMSSNVLRAAYELSTGATGLAAPFHSLDAAWCFDWPLQWQVNPHGHDGTLIC